MPADFRKLLLAGAMLLGLAPARSPALEPAHLVAGFPRGQVVLETSGPRCLLIDLYIASTPRQRSQGLMFVESLGEFEGMYFGNDTPAVLVMWMKNTVLSLDMLFIRPDGAIGTIVRDTKPYSTARISSGDEAIGVLELNAGFARRWRVETGTRLLT